MALPLLPCPVVIGEPRADGLPALLQEYTLGNKVQKLTQVLKQGVNVDSTNRLGQTPLFCASLLGLTKIVLRLLQYGANPNHRCYDLSTPVHGAVFSCNTELLSSLLDAGGDLRLHDDNGRTPKDWANAGAQENSPKMLAFLDSCACEVRRLLESRPSRETPTSSKSLRSSASMFTLWPLREKKFVSQKDPCDDTFRFGFGKIRLGSLGLLLDHSVPLISDRDLDQTPDEPLTSFTCGSMIFMTNYCWRESRVTVKQLHFRSRSGKKHSGLQDLLLAEQDYCGQLAHPHLLQLMAVGLSFDLSHIKLVYERVHIGSLYGLLHQRKEFPLMPLVDLLEVMLQVCDGLRFLHGRSLVLRALSSHSVLIVHPGVAKVTGLGFMVPSFACPGSRPHVPLPLDLINWAAPEVVDCEACSESADVYSVSALMQEIYTDNVPWGSTEPRCIKGWVKAGRSLPVHPFVPEPYFQFLHASLQFRAQDRTSTLHDLCYILRSHIREKINDKKRSKSWGSAPDEMRGRGPQHNPLPAEDLSHHYSQFVPAAVLDSDSQIMESTTEDSTQSLSDSDPQENEGDFYDSSNFTEEEINQDWQQAEKILRDREAWEFDVVDGDFQRISEHVTRGPPFMNYCPEFVPRADEVTADTQRRAEGKETRLDLTGHHRSVQFCRSPVGQPTLSDPIQMKPRWTSHVSEIVALQSRGWFGKSLESVSSSDTLEIQHQRHPEDVLQVSRSVSNFQLKSKACEHTDLEKVFKSFAGIHSDSEESSTDITISSGDQLEDGGYSIDVRPFSEPSTMFYTPRDDLSPPNNIFSDDQLSHLKPLNSVLDITYEVCRPSTSQEEQKSTNVALRALPDEDEHEEENETISAGHKPTLNLSCLHDLAEIREMSIAEHPVVNSTPRGCRTLEETEIQERDAEPQANVPSQTTKTTHVVSEDHSLDETERANCSLDVVLEKILLEHEALLLTSHFTQSTT